MTIRRRQLLQQVGASIAFPGISRLAYALDYPIRSVRVIVPFVAGGATDIAGRLISQWLSERLHELSARHTRCVCHTINNAPFHLVELSPGATTWNDEQSRQNFQLIQKVVVPGYEDSRLLKHPLTEEAGGDPRHNGGQQFASKNDPDWQTLRAWVMGAK